MAASNPTEPDLVSAISTETDMAPGIREREGAGIGGAEAIAPGMAVIGADGAHLGTVASVGDGEIVLAPGDGDADHPLLPLSLVDVVSDGRVMMRAAGGGAFGIAD